MGIGYLCKGRVGIDSLTDICDNWYMENIYQTYAGLRDKRDTLDRKIEQMGEKIVKTMVKSETPEVETNDGIFRLRVNKTWNYTKAVQAIVTRLTLLKRTEEVTGKAKVAKTSTTLVYSA